jgi:hypothetical protein
LTTSYRCMMCGNMRAGAAVRRGRLWRWAINTDQLPRPSSQKNTQRCQLRWDSINYGLWYMYDCSKSNAQGGYAWYGCRDAAGPSTLVESHRFFAETERKGISKAVLHRRHALVLAKWLEKECGGAGGRRQEAVYQQQIDLVEFRRFFGK